MKEPNIKIFERFIKPSKSVGKSVLVHNFTDEFLQEKGEDKKTVFNDFMNFSRNALIIGHNVNYDISIFNSEIERCKQVKSLRSVLYINVAVHRYRIAELLQH